MGGMTKVATIIRLTTIHALLLLAAVILVPRLMAATPLKKVRLAYSAFAYANPPFWIAQELKLFEKYGLDTELVYVSGARPIQAMLGGSIDVSQVGGAATVAAAAQGADVAILGTIFTRLNFAVHASAQIKQITQAAAADLKAQHEAGHKLHEQGMALFTQPTVDPVAAEALRQQMLARHDQASKRVLQAMLDISKVLTPEQRQQLAERLKKRHEMMRRHHHERAELDAAPR